MGGDMEVRAAAALGEEPRVAVVVSRLRKWIEVCCLYLCATVCQSVCRCIHGAPGTEVRAAAALGEEAR